MIGPLDLTKQPPRSAREELDGSAYLPRAIDKIRAAISNASRTRWAGEVAEFDTRVTARICERRPPRSERRSTTPKPQR